MQSGALRRRIIQIHPTQQCNLRCLHCYSESGPELRGFLRFDDLCEFLYEAVEQGYEVASFSGGEPLLYSRLFDALEFAKSLGLITSVTTNGTVFGQKRLASLQGLVDTFAVSIDGRPERHNLMRQSDKAFESALRGIAQLREADFTFGLIHTVTAESLIDIRWIAETAIKEGAKLLQLHPIENVGRAAQKLGNSKSNSNIFTRVYLLSLLLQKDFSKDLKIQVDLFNRETLAKHPEIVFASDPSLTKDRLSDLINPLVLEPTGDIVPICYGFGRRYRIGEIGQKPINEMFAEYAEITYPKFKILCRELYEKEIASDDLPYFNWYEELARQSQNKRHVAAPHSA